MLKHLLCCNMVFLLLTNFCTSQRVSNVVQAFEALNSEPEITEIINNIDVPTKGGHLQGVQFVEVNGSEKLLMSGSSLAHSYILQIDLKKKKAEKVINLMEDPYRHAGGFQVSGDFLAVGIEDNYAKTFSKVCIYNYKNNSLNEARPAIVIDRKGKEKEKTAGATGLLEMDSSYLAVVSNWDSRQWDFYRVNKQQKRSQLLSSFNAPDAWGSYQSINLIADSIAIYAIAFYDSPKLGHADLILVSNFEHFQPIMEKIATKSFHCRKGADFNAAAGLQVNENGQLHIWAVQKQARAKIVVNKFSSR